MGALEMGGLEHLTKEQKDNLLIWHPYTHYNSLPNIFIKKGEAQYLYDDKGNRYIDAIASWWVSIHGHCNKYIAESVYKQIRTLDHVIFGGFTHSPAIDLSERILRLIPYHSKVFFSDNGSTSVEVAIKMALQTFHNQGINKKRIIAFKDSYHGDTFGAMSVSSRSVFTEAFQDMLFDVEYIDLPTDENISELIERFEGIMSKGDVAAFIYEPLVLGAGGMKIYKAEHLEKLLETAQKHQVIKIADEVMTGFGRTGKMFASEYLKVKPDIICLSKGLAGGILPMGLTTCNDTVYKGFENKDKTKTFYHGHSFTGNPITCAAAIASLDLFEKENLLAKIDNINKQHITFVKKLNKYQQYCNPKCIGVILSIEFTNKDKTAYLNNMRDEIYNFFIKRQIIIRPLGNVLYIIPPYCIDNKDLLHIYNVIIDFIQKKSVK